MVGIAIEARAGAVDESPPPGPDGDESEFEAGYP